MEVELFVFARDVSCDDMLTRKNQIFRVVTVEQTKVDPDDEDSPYTEGVWLRNISTGVSLILASDEFDAHEFKRVEA